jgi:hypothetical protein
MSTNPLDRSTEGRDRAPEMECPPCGEDAVSQPTADRVPWGAHGLERPEWSHRDGSSLCPVIGPSGGYEPAQPRERAQERTAAPEAATEDMGRPPTEAELAEIVAAFEAGEPTPDIYEPEDMRIWRSERQAPPEAAQGEPALDEIDDDGISGYYANWKAGREPQTDVEAGWHEHWRQQDPEARAVTEDWTGENENPYKPFTPEHRVWAIARVSPEMTDADVLVHAGWVPHDGTTLRDDLLALYRRESAAGRQAPEAAPPEGGAGQSGGGPWLAELEPGTADEPFAQGWSLDGGRHGLFTLGSGRIIDGPDREAEAS